MAATECVITFKVDDSPLLSFVASLNAFIERGDLIVPDPELPEEIARIEEHGFTAGTHELRITLHPSDAFVRYGLALRAANGEPCVVE